MSISEPFIRRPIATSLLMVGMLLAGLGGYRLLPVAALPPVAYAVSRVLPLTYAVRLLQGIWTGDPWSAHLGDIAALAAGFVVCTAVSAKVFRWE